MFCREHVVQLHREASRIHAVGGELVVLGNGANHYVAGFREVTGYDGLLYCDPSLKTYQAAGLKRGVCATLHPRSAARLVVGLMRGSAQGWTQGDEWQQGGVLVIMPPDDVVYHHVSRFAGDNADAAEVVTALERAVHETP